MQRRLRIALLGLLGCFLWHDALGAGTRYRVTTSVGFEALCLVGILSGDPFYLDYYAGDHAWWSARLPPGAIDAARRVKAVVKDEGGGIVSATLVLYLSPARHENLDLLIADLDEPEVLRRRFASTPYWSEAGWARFLRIVPDVRTVLRALRDGGFAAYWDSALRPRLAAQARSVQATLARLDLVSMQERMLGHPLPDRAITVYLVHFTEPHGIKVVGNRFLASETWPPAIVIRTAIHEMMHPPFDLQDAGVWAAVAPLATEPAVASRLAAHDRSFGYNSFEGLFEEGVVQALDQVIGERLGVAEDAAARWRRADDGLHVIAVAVHAAMLADGFAARGGNLAAWLSDPATVARVRAELARMPPVP